MTDWCIICPAADPHARAIAGALVRRGDRVVFAHGLESPAAPVERCLPWVMVRDVAKPVYGRYELALALEATGVRMITSAATIARAADKLVCGLVWSLSGLPTPESFPVDSPLPDGWYIVKPRHGWKNHDVVVLGAEEAIERAGLVSDGRFVQRFIDSARRIRLIATGQNVVAAYEQQCDTDEGIAPVSLGDKHVPLRPTDELRELAMRAVAVLGGGIMGIDVLEDRDGSYWLIDANVPFGFDLDDPDLAIAIADSIQQL